MTDFITNLRKEQSNLAGDIAQTLFNEAKPYIANGKYQGLQGYVNKDIIPDVNELPEGNEINKGALEAMVISDLKRDTMLAVRFYGEWIASRIVREGDYSVPTPEEIDFDAIQDVAGIGGTEVLNRVIRYMNSQPELPLLGRIEKGHFKPDHGVFEEWKDLYEWGESK